VAVKAISSGAIDIELLFWLNRLKASATILRSDIISQINSTFNEAGIVIPNPQQDLYYSISAR
jgi:small-conductance mechanosensitive channel